MLELYDRIRHNTEETKSLLSMAIGNPAKGFLQKLPGLVYDISGHVLFVSRDKNTITGVIGIDITTAPHAWILHLAVRPEYRRQGIGKKLIIEAMSLLSLKSVTLETDQDAVDFYRACGFTAVEIESKWPGIHRFRCVKGQPPKSVIK